MSTPVSAQYIINTVGGDGTAGYTGDGGAATSAHLSPFYGIAVDASGNAYIACGGDNVVRKISSSGTITTIAGSGSSGYTGDGGAATAATFHTPIGVAVDAGGSNLYIADRDNNVVRLVNLGSGVVNTFAGNGAGGFSGDGGPATSAKLRKPIAVAIDQSGFSSNVYITDNNNTRIRYVSSGTINTYVGNGTPGYTGDGGAAATAEVTNPAGVAVDGSGNLFVADYGNNVIRKINTSGTISTFAGTAIKAGQYHWFRCFCKELNLLKEAVSKVRDSLFLFGYLMEKVFV